MRSSEIGLFGFSVCRISAIIFWTRRAALKNTSNETSSPLGNCFKFAVRGAADGALVDSYLVGQAGSSSRQLEESLVVAGAEECGLMADQIAAHPGQRLPAHLKAANKRASPLYVGCQVPSLVTVADERVIAQLSSLDA